MNAAVLLAGGFATRFEGGDKAVACVAGSPMIRRVATAVGPLVDDLIVNARPEQRAALDEALDGLPFSYRYAFDEVPDRGPLYGMEAGLAATEAEYTLVVACDMPFVEPTFVDVLFARAAGMDAAIPVERCADGSWLQPLQAVYHTETMQTAARTALDRGVDNPVDVIADLEYERVVVPDATDGNDSWTLRNVNTAEELREAERRLPDARLADR